MTREQRLTFELIIIISLAILFYASTVSGSQPYTVARNSFEALSAAEASGANITGLVAQYNSLLEQSGNEDSAFSSLQSQTMAAEQAALASRAATNTLTIVLIPIIPFFLALLTAGILGIARMVERERRLDMEVKEA